MKTFKKNIIIEVFNLKVSKQGFYSFDWEALVDGKVKRGSYDSSYSGQTARAIRGKLERGYAIQLAVQDLFGF